MQFNVMPRTPVSMEAVQRHGKDNIDNKNNPYLPVTQEQYITVDV